MNTTDSLGLMTAVYLRPHKATTGTQLFVYKIVGATVEQKTAYKAHKGDDYQEQDGCPLFYTAKTGLPSKINVKHYIDKNGGGQYIPDDSALVLFKSCVQEHGIEMAKIMHPDFVKSFMA